MFLVLLWLFYHIIEYILLFTKENSVFVGIVTSVIASLFWLKKFIKQKRAEAFFGFYARLYLKLRTLFVLLEENGQLECSDEKSGNIYSLLYAKNSIEEFCPKYKIPSDKKMIVYKKAAQELIDILLKTENNVYPQNANKKAWYDSQYILLSFCEFIVNDNHHHSTNKKFLTGENEPKHIKKCKSVVQAMEYLKNSIENAKY